MKFCTHVESEGGKSCGGSVWTIGNEWRCSRGHRGDVESTDKPSPLVDQRGDIARICLDIIAERRSAWHERHDDVGEQGCRALDGAAHEIAKRFGLLA